MAVTVIWDLEKAVRQARIPLTIGDLASGDGRYFRHPDSVHVSYPLVVSDPDTGSTRPIGTLAPGSALRVGIAGGGPGGIAALYELSRVASPARPIEVTLFESDPDNFLFKPKPAPPVASISQRRAGRVSSYTAPNTVYEIGAMRFPSIAGLTWHYAQEVYGPNPVVTPFPNPGTVPTEFVFGSQFDRYMGDNWLDPTSPTLAVKTLVIEGLVLDPNMYPIGTQSAGDVIPILKSPGATQTQLDAIEAGWRQFIRDHDGTSLEGAVRHILTQYSARLPAVAGLGGEQLISWCVELFGRFGFGTGGFKPLFNMSLVEMMRLMLWDYSNEYTLPANLAPANVDFIEELCNRAKATPNFTVIVKQARVSDVFNRTTPPVQAAVAYYPSAPAGAPIAFEYFDYTILALPHDVAAQLVSRLGYGTSLENVAVGDAGSAAIPPGSPIMITALWLSGDTGQPAVNARAVTAIGTLHMTRSSKVFATISEADATGALVPVLPPGGTNAGGPISAVVSDCGLAATYMVPSTTDAAYRSFLVSYTWDDDSTKLQNALTAWPEYAPPEGTNPMSGAMVNRAFHIDPGSQGLTPPKWWLSRLLETVQNSADQVSYDWSTYTTAGGFKLDNTGDYYQSSLCFRYHTQAAVSTLNLSRFFLAGCSFSHLGGWLEGAFMSAINAVAGIVVAANGRGPTAVQTLNTEAQKLFTTLDPVVPMV